MANQELEPPGIDRTHLAYVPHHVTLRDEGRQRGLIEHRAMHIGADFGSDKRTLRPWRRNDKAQANAGKQALGEGAHIEDQFVAVERLQRIERSASEAKFRV